jgi:hypothetical protein
MMVVFMLVFVGNVFAESVNTALKFDGTNDYGTVAHNASLSPQVGGQMTLSTWVKFDALPVGENAVPVSKGSGNTYEYNITVWTDAQVSFCLWRPTGSSYAVAKGGTITTGQWHNITSTYMQGQYIKVYLDGDLVNQSSSFNPPIGSGNSGFYFGKIGGNPETHSWFNGVLDDVSIWNYAMTDTQVQQLFSTTLIGSESGLAAYWNFNEGSGQTLTDITGHGNNGILGSGSGVDNADPTWVAGVPEPATMAMLALGGLMLRRRMR